MRVRRPLQNLLLLSASLVVVLGVLELALRALGPTACGFSYRRGVFSQAPEFKLDDTRNQRGFHDEEPGMKEPGSVRVLLLGDSYAAGVSVRVDQIVGQRTEAHLNGGDGPRFDVVSLAQPGWGPREELQALHRFGPALAPDLVVSLFLPLNDVRNAWPPLQQAAREQERRMRELRPHWVRVPREQVPFFWFERSRLNQLVSYRLSVLGSPPLHQREIPLDYRVYALAREPTWEAAWRETRRLLLATRAWAVLYGARYAVLSASTPQGVFGPIRGLEILLEHYPAMREQAWDLELPNRRLADFCRHSGIPFLSLEPHLREIVQGGRRLHWEKNGHWNAEGHDEAGRAIAAFLRDLVASTPSGPVAEPAQAPGE